MPTRYTLELEGLKGVVSADTFKEVSQREDAKKTVKKVLEDRYTSGKNRWFFTPLSTLSRLVSISHEYIWDQNTNHFLSRPIRVLNCLLSLKLGCSGRGELVRFFVRGLNMQSISGI